MLSQSVILIKHLLWNILSNNNYNIYLQSTNLCILETEFHKILQSFVYWLYYTSRDFCDDLIFAFFMITFTSQNGQ